MIVLVTGGRDYLNAKLIFRFLTAFYNVYGITKLIHGNAKGADTLCALWAEDNNIETKSYPVTKEDWDKKGKAAGHIRNSLMLSDNPDIQYLLAFKGSKGTANMVNQTKQLNKKRKELLPEIRIITIKDAEIID